jgi:hypothetical protein
LRGYLGHDPEVVLALGVGHVPLLDVLRRGLLPTPETLPLSVYIRLLPSPPSLYTTPAHTNVSIYDSCPLQQPSRRQSTFSENPFGKLTPFGSQQTCATPGCASATTPAHPSNTPRVSSEVNSVGKSTDTSHRPYMRLLPSPPTLLPSQLRWEVNPFESQPRSEVNSVRKSKTSDTPGCAPARGVKCDPWEQLLALRTCPVHIFLLSALPDNPPGVTTKALRGGYSQANFPKNQDFSVKS